jgi:hypothetical protein
LEELLRNSTVHSKLVGQLERAVPQLQDQQLDDKFQPIAEPTTAAAEAAADQELTWRDNVELVPVAASGPGHRARNPQSASQVLAVVPKADFAAGHLVGLYLGRLGLVLL